jgi:HD-GYP domain-containing protein (c-di-GMP phosphodiesterase class II)
VSIDYYQDMGINQTQEVQSWNQESEDYKKGLNLLYRVGKKVGSVSEISKLLDQTLRMTQRTLQSQASSVILIDQGKGELYFQIAGGQAGNSLKKVRLSLDSGIAGWVARNSKPLIVNDVSQDTRFNKNVDETTGFVTRSILAVPLVSGREIIGVLEVLNKTGADGFTERDMEVSTALAATVATAISNARLHQAVLAGYKGTIGALAAAIDAKDPYTRGHSQRVMEYALVGGSSLLPEDDLEVLEYAAILHDVGKIGISDSILNKAGALTPEELTVIRTHPVIGANMLRDIPFLEKAGILIRHHHERYDGNGYAPTTLPRASATLSANYINSPAPSSAPSRWRPLSPASGSGTTPIPKHG